MRSPLEHEITKRVTPDKPEFHVDGWTDSTGAHHKLTDRGRARVGGDSIQFYEQDYATWAEPNPTPKSVATVSRSVVATVDVRKFSPVKTGILLLSPVAAFYLLLFLTADPS
ncbi:MAG TPA: hypothetical protein VJX91_00640 [Candidatus Eisenbacteria bacterium]|nr:hypothetical protein [Candidatus Eisenbacteria bacterium]